MSKVEELHKTIYEMMTGKYVTDLRLLYKLAHEAKLEAAQQTGEAHVLQLRCCERLKIKCENQ